VLLMIGANDAAASATGAAMFAKIQSIRSALTAEGINVYHLAVTPSSGRTNINDLNALLMSNYPDWYIDVNTPLNSSNTLAAAYDCGDDLHPNNAGYQLIADTVRTAKPSLF
jgi:lysophospholipase L1-like esterase